jgi:HSP20 family protein
MDDRKLPIFAEFDEIADQIRKYAYELCTRRGFAGGHELDDWLTAERKICWPAAELTEEDDEFELKVALAGFEPEDIDVTATPKELIIKASHEKKEEGEREKVCWSEFRSNDVYRRVELPGEIDVDKIEAKFSRGMLEIEAHKLAKKARRAKKVKISSAA